MAITVKHTKVSTIPDGDDTSVVRPSDWNADHQLVGTVPVANGGTGASTLTGYVKGNGTSAMTASTTIPNTDITGLGTASTKDAGVALGVATLDSAGKVPITQIPDSVIGALSYQGTWNASTNTPTLTSSVGTKGFYYVVSVAGTTNLNGVTDWKIGDWAVFDGLIWEKIDNTDSVTSVNGYTGAVVLTNTDISGFGTMSTQNANAVAITGGAINGTTIGATTPASVKGTTGQFTDTLTLPVSTTSASPLKMPYGVAPTSPVQGDIWSAYTGLYFKNADNTVEQLDLGSNAAGTLSNPVITVAGSGATIDVTSVEAVLFSLPAWQGDYRKYVIPAATGLALTDQSANYLIVSYNAGSPVYSITTNPALITNSDVVGATLLWRDGTQVHYQTINWGLSTASRINRRLVQTNRYQRASGLALGESTGNVITLTAGNIWYGVSEIVEGAVTSASSNADFYYHVAGVWTKSTVSTYNITQYDTGTALATLANGRYAVNWVYRYLDGSGLPKLAYILGGGDYNLAQAVASGTPTPPPILSTMAILVGRIIVKKNDATATQIDSAFSTTFASTSVTSHNDLAGLQGGTANEYFHLTSSEYTGTGTGTFVRQTSPTINTSATLNYGTINQVQYLDASKNLVGSQNLTFDGTILTAISSTGDAELAIRSTFTAGTDPDARLILDAANSVGESEVEFRTAGVSKALVQYRPAEAELRIDGFNEAVNIWTGGSSTLLLDAAGNANLFGSMTNNKGYYAKNQWSGTYTDGIVMDYITGTGRFTVGSADGFAWRNNGVTSPVSLMTLDTSGNLSTIGKIIANGTLEVNGSATNSILKLSRTTSAAGSGYIYANSTDMFGVNNGGALFPFIVSQSAPTYSLWISSAGGVSIGNNTNAGANNLSVTGSATIQGLTVGKGGGAVANNTAVGNAALAATATGDKNTGVGFNALTSLTSGTNNTAVGWQALYTNDVGLQNTAVGSRALFANTGTANSALGYFALTANTSGVNNNAVGYNALSANLTNNNCNAFGYLALQNSVADNNASFGHQAGRAITSGAQNTILGANAGYSGTNNLTTGSSNTFIGYATAAFAIGDSNEIVIGASATGLGSNTTVIGNSSTTLTKVFGVIKATTYTVATLPSASTSGVGAGSFVTDALAPTFGATVVGSGAIATPVYSDGTNWKVG